MRNKASTDVSKASTDNIHQQMSASTDKASTTNASTDKTSTDKASTDKASTDESFNGCLYFGLSEDQVPIILVQTSDMEAEQIAPWLKDYMVTGIPIVFVSALEGRGRITVMDKVIDTYGKWCLRLTTARLNRWLRTVMGRHSWKDSASQPKIKYFTQVKARPPTFVAFVSGKKQLADSELKFLTRSLKEDFDLGGIPVRVMQRIVVKNNAENSSNNKRTEYTGKIVER
ncbi:hypothetical protein AgCh_023181 [Apium graveolens]